MSIDGRGKDNKAIPYHPTAHPDVDESNFNRPYPRDCKESHDILKYCGRCALALPYQRGKHVFKSCCKNELHSRDHCYDILKA